MSGTRTTSGTATGTAAAFQINSAYTYLQVLNRGTATLWFTTDGVTVPTVGGDDCYPVLTNAFITVSNDKKPPNPIPGGPSSIAIIADAATCEFTLFGTNLPQFFPSSPNG